MATCNIEGKFLCNSPFFHVSIYTCLFWGSWSCYRESANKKKMIILKIFLFYQRIVSVFSSFVYGYDMKRETKKNSQHRRQEKETKEEKKRTEKIDENGWSKQ